MKTIALIGATGTIGAQVCEVVRRHSDKFKIASLVARSNTEIFLKQVQEFKPAFAALTNETAGKKIAPFIPAGVKFAYGQQAALDAVAYGEVVMNAATGFAGLQYSLRAIEEKKSLALANKETLVCGGELVMRKIRGAGVDLMPVDSEHSALWQALSFRTDAPFKRLIITASGGPFYGWSKERLESVTPQMALKHPTWSMGAKITIDSATLLNKGFEVIEAKWLYDCPIEKIDAVVQPTSIVHSLVEFEDHGILAQMSYPTMELPIQLALSYPERLKSNLPQMDLVRLGKIEFLPLNRKDFPCFDLALKSAEMGDNYSCVLNGAGEVAVQAFLQNKISFLQIAEVLSYALENAQRQKPTSFEILKQSDFEARELAKAYIAKDGK